MNAKTYNAPTISAGTITRTAVLLLALTNQILSACGKPITAAHRERDQKARAAHGATSWSPLASPRWPR